MDRSRRKVIKNIKWKVVEDQPLLLPYSCSHMQKRHVIIDQESIDLFTNNKRWHERKTDTKGTSEGLRWMADVIGSSKWGVHPEDDDVISMMRVFLAAAEAMESIDPNVDSYEITRLRKEVAKNLTDSLGITSINKRSKISGKTVLDLFYRYTMEQGLGKMDAYNKIASEHELSGHRMVAEAIKSAWKGAWDEYYTHMELINGKSSVNRYIPKDPVKYWATVANQSVQDNLNESGAPDPDNYFKDW